MNNITMLDLANIGFKTPKIKSYTSEDDLRTGQPLLIGILEGRSHVETKLCKTIKEKEEYIAALRSVLGKNVHIFIREIPTYNVVYRLTITQDGYTFDRVVADEHIEFAETVVNAIRDKYTITSQITLAICVDENGDPIITEIM